MEQKTRVRINLIAREIEWEGSEEFIAKYDNTISAFIEKIQETSPTIAAQNYPTGDSNKKNMPPAVQSKGDLPDSFGEYYTSFPRNIKVVDKMMIASYFVQQKSTDGMFTIKEAADLLNEQNVLVTNPNAFVKSLLKTGKLFKSAGKYKVSEKGIEMINNLNTQA